LDAHLTLNFQIFTMPRKSGLFYVYRKMSMEPTTGAAATLGGAAVCASAITGAIQLLEDFAVFNRE
jgi:hypothetical protein